ncbi:hypothetical protein [Streptomyces sp. NPDC048361]|uniref:hypothetical protein n=1 Tax=Streptomyces sp. NPDC048361 TaxID=3154720 RepID=UPI00341C902B
MVLRTAHRGELDLADGLLAVAERHRAEHEVHHVAIDLAGWSREHAARLAAAGHGYDLDLDGPPDASAPSFSGTLAALGRKTAETGAHRPEPGLLLLRDLCELHLAASEHSLHWEMLAQAAQAARDSDLLHLVTSCHPQTLRQMRWTNTMIKILSPQVLTSL